jgi:hypothetical protein
LDLSTKYIKAGLPDQPRIPADWHIPLQVYIFVTADERMTGLKEKALITMFFLGNAIDSTSTPFILSQEGWKEMNSMAAHKFMSGDLYQVIMVKMLLTAALIGTYALAKGINSKLEYPLEKVLRIGNIIIWTVLVWNTANVLATVFIA